jgi:elongation factor G
MLELAGGRFDNLDNGVCRSGDVCALVGLRTVVTGDTIMLKGDSKYGDAGAVCLAGVASPKPVLTVRLEVETAEQQKRLSEALSTLVIEDPSLVVKETESTTLLSGLGELHIEITVDRLAREFGLEVSTGKPAVAYRESLTEKLETPGGLWIYDRTIGNNRLQAAVHLVLEPKKEIISDPSSLCMVISEPTVTLGIKAREFLGLHEMDLDDDELIQFNELARTLVLACQGAMRRGPLGSYALANVSCHVVSIDAEGGLASLQAMPGALRAAAASAISETLLDNKSSCTLMEPTMSVEVTVPGDMVGAVVSDLTGRRGNVGDVLMSDSGGAQHATKALIRGQVPLAEILGYANSLRSLTGGEGSFTAEYAGHSSCDETKVG